MKKLRFADYIIKYLTEEEHLDYYFGITGKSISAIVDAGENFDGIQQITAKHEGGASYMAYGYAQASGKTGVCFGTTGGGSTNLLTGVASAYANSVPMLVLTGQVQTTTYGKGAFQEVTGIGRSVNITELFRPAVKESLTIERADRAVDLFHYAMRKIHNGRKGPVHINIPIDIQLAEVDIPESRSLYNNKLSMTSSNAELTAKAIDLLEESQRPLLYIGWGTELAKAGDILISFAEAYNIPMVSSPQGKGIVDHSHPLYAGVMGLGGHESAERILRKSDLLIVAGSSLNEFATLRWSSAFLKPENIIQIDTDAAEIGKNFPVSLALPGDVGLEISKLHQAAGQRQAKPKKVSAPYMIIYDEPQAINDLAVPIKPQRLMSEIRAYTPNDTLFLADSGSHCSWAIQYIDILKGGHFYASFGFGAMGVSVAAAIGVKLARPQQPVVAIVGDGTFAMHGTEIAVAAYYTVGVIWVIVNDLKFGMPEAGSLRLYGRTAGIDLPDIDFAAMAKAYNIAGYRITKPGEIQPVLEKHIRENSPAVIDVRVDTTQVPLVGERLDYGDK